MEIHFFGSFSIDFNATIFPAPSSPSSVCWTVVTLQWSCTGQHGPSATSPKSTVGGVLGDSVVVEEDCCVVATWPMSMITLFLHITQ